MTRLTSHTCCCQGYKEKKHIQMSSSQEKGAGGKKKGSYRMQNQEGQPGLRVQTMAQQEICIISCSSPFIPSPSSFTLLPSFLLPFFFPATSICQNPYQCPRNCGYTNEQNAKITSLMDPIILCACV